MSKEIEWGMLHGESDIVCTVEFLTKQKRG